MEYNKEFLIQELKALQNQVLWSDGRNIMNKLSEYSHIWETDKEKYYISAFYNKKDIEKGKSKVREWRDFYTKYLQ